MSFYLILTKFQITKNKFQTALQYLWINIDYFIRLFFYYLFSGASVKRRGTSVFTFVVFDYILSNAVKDWYQLSVRQR
jgi:hypothetical protein